MPNAKVLSEKQAIVAALTEKLQNAAAGLIVDYKGITVAEDTALRADCRENNVDYAVVKNTLLRFAFNNVGFHSRSARAAGPGSGYHAGSHLCSGLRAEADRREERRSRRGSRRRVNPANPRGARRPTQIKQISYN